MYVLLLPLKKQKEKSLLHNLLANFVFAGIDQTKKEPSQAPLPSISPVLSNQGFRVFLCNPWGP
jgi:hypothetical protein